MSKLAPLRNVLAIVLLLLVELPKQPLRWLRQVESDKLQHFVVGILASTAAATVLAPAALHLLPIGKALIALAVIGLMAAFVAGLFKELCDAVDRWNAKRTATVPTSHVDPWDLVATFAGGAPLAVALVVLAVWSW